MKVKFGLAVFLFSIQSLALAQSKLDTLQLLHDLQALSADSLQGRKACSVGSKKAQAYILTAFQQSHLQAFNGNYKQIFSFSANGVECNEATNLVGYISGDSSGCIVLSAHYDHLGVVNGKTYYGADDNASGVAAMLAFIKYFTQNKPRHTLVFAIFDAEEAGLLGAKAFLNNLPFEKKRLALNVNLDMVSRNAQNELYAAGAKHYPFLKPYLEQTAKISAVKLLLGHDHGLGFDNWTYSSDHAPFHEAGIPFVYFGVEDHADYHQPTDTFANIDPPFFFNAAATILAAVLAFDHHLAEIIQARARLTE